MSVVKAVVIGSADKITHGSSSVISQDSHDRIDRTNVTSATAHVLMDFIVAGETEFAYYLGYLDFVQHVVSA